MVMAAAIIVAGGSGKRMPGDRPKQYLSLADVPILARTLITFEKTPSVGRIIVVAPQRDISYVREQIIGTYHIVKVHRILAGGGERQDSVRNGLKMIDDRDDVVLIHDGVRPLVTRDLIERSIREAERSGAVIPVIPVTDTVKMVDERGVVSKEIAIVISQAYGILVFGNVL